MTHTSKTSLPCHSTERADISLREKCEEAREIGLGIFKDQSLVAALTLVSLGEKDRLAGKGDGPDEVRALLAQTRKAKIRAAHAARIS
jgi:hypothetical protein